MSVQPASNFPLVYDRIMRLERVLGFSAVLAVITAVAGGLYRLNTDAAVGAAVWEMIRRFVVVMAFAPMGLFMADQTRIRGSVITSSEDRTTAFLTLVNWGLLPGVLLGVINYLFFFAHRYSPFIIAPIRNMHTFYDSFILSFSSASSEEAVFRLFMLSCMLYSFRHLYVNLLPVWPWAVKILPTALAMVTSSLLFAMAHSLYSFTAAFFGGMVLGGIYCWGGIESAIIAHFVADFLFFSAAYLS